MTKVRIYEIARELGMNNRELVTLFQSLGFSEVRNHMSAVETEVVERVKRKLERKAEPDVVEQRINRTVVKRKARPGRIGAPPSRTSQEGAPSSRGEPSYPGPTPSSNGDSAPGRARPSRKASPTPPPSRHSAPGAAMQTEPAADSLPSARLSDRGDAAWARSEAPPSAPHSAGMPDETMLSRNDGPAHAPSQRGAQSDPGRTAPPADDRGDRGEPITDFAEAMSAEPAVKPMHHHEPHEPVSSRRREPEETAPAAGLRSDAPAADAVPESRGAETAEDKDADGDQKRRRPTTPPKTGIEVWEGRPGVPMPQRPRTTTSGPPSARRTTYDPRANAAGQNRFGRQRPQARQRPGGGFNRRSPYRDRRKGPSEVSTKEMSDRKKVIKIEGESTLQLLAAKMSMKATDVLMRLLSMGMVGVHINSTLDADTVKLLAAEFGWSVEDRAVDVDEQIAAAHETEVDVGEAQHRPPIVTVMGHVDHGKTTLLDTIRKTDVAGGEAGGITQHIGAYRVETKRGTVCFLDTPGHEAFTAMRARGASVTDLVILLVAADDGVMPQTKEAIAHARDAEVPIIVAINKIDKHGVDVERIMRDLANEGLQPEEWGGTTIMCKVSATTGQGVDQLLEMILLQSEMLELRAHPQKRAMGVVVEALLDRGRGPVARVLVQDGQLMRGDVLLAGSAYGKIRAMTDDKGRDVKIAGAATPVEVLGLNAVPDAGDPVHAVVDLKTAESLADERRRRSTKSVVPQDARISLEALAYRLAEGDALELKIIIKADVQGSVEALAQALSKLTTKKVKLGIVQTGVGGITESDVNLAIAAGAVIIGFNVRPAGKAQKHAEQEGVEIRLYSIIYEAIDDVRGAMEGLLPAKQVEKALGKAEVRQVFRISKFGAICGCMVTDGVIKRSAQARLIRDNVVIWTGSLSSLKRFKDDAREVRDGLECGIGLEAYNDQREGDVIEAFEIEEVKATLD